MQLRLDKDIGSFRIGLNIVSLAHRAASRLPARAATLSWRLTPGQVADVPQPPRVFLMPSNKRDPQHAQPEGFVLPLRKEQLRSLWWMLEQERATDPTFVEEEISEAALPALGWRAEGKAERPVLVRGGVIADQVGYGKTIISLALIAESKEKAAPEPAPKGLIDLKATLIVVPGHLSKQWPSEIDRFTGNMFRVIVIQNMKDLNSRSIAELSKADIIVMASEIFEADGYWSRFEYLSAQSEEWLSDKMGGRFFCDRLDAAIGSLRDQTSRLDSEGSQAVLDHMDDRQRKATEDAKAQREAQKTAQYGKRQKGQAYRDRYDAIDGKKAKKATVEEVQKWEASEDEEEEEVAALPVPTYRKASGTDSFGSSSVKKDSRLLTAPVMHMFRYVPLMRRLTTGSDVSLPTSSPTSRKSHSRLFSASNPATNGSCPVHHLFRIFPPFAALPPSWASTSEWRTMQKERRSIKSRAPRSRPMRKSSMLSARSIPLPGIDAATISRRSFLIFSSARISPRSTISRQSSMCTTSSCPHRKGLFTWSSSIICKHWRCKRKSRVD